MLIVQVSVKAPPWRSPLEKLSVAQGCSVELIAREGSVSCLLKSSHLSTVGSHTNYSPTDSVEVQVFTFFALEAKDASVCGVWWWGLRQLLMSYWRSLRHWISCQVGSCTFVSLNCAVLKVGACEIQYTLHVHTDVQFQRTCACCQAWFNEIMKCMFFFNMQMQTAYTNYVKVKNTAPSLSRSENVFHCQGAGNLRIQVSRFGVHKFIIVYHETGSVGRHPGSGRISKVTDHMKMLLLRNKCSEMMKHCTSTPSHTFGELCQHFFQTILRCWKVLGWTFRGSTYCQLIWKANKTKRLEWCYRYKEDRFDDVIWIDESTIQLEAHRWYCCCKQGRIPRPKPWCWNYVCMKLYIHEYTHMCIAQIGFMQDNDPKHTSIFAWDFITDNCINWWKTRVESPDLNLIENTWHELKELCMREVKPSTEQELIDGTVQFWETVLVEKCKKYINHKFCHAL